ncbi:MAG: hypothetical protein CMH54_04485 [Myxococcales bacterium]|nr:hypothetical protein [Myxococcales bacterium]
MKAESPRRKKHLRILVGVLVFHALVGYLIAGNGSKSVMAENAYIIEPQLQLYVPLKPTNTEARLFDAEILLDRAVLHGFIKKTRKGYAYKKRSIGTTRRIAARWLVRNTQSRQRLAERITGQVHPDFVQDAPQLLRYPMQRRRSAKRATVETCEQVFLPNQTDIPGECQSEMALMQIANTHCMETDQTFSTHTLVDACTEFPGLFRTIRFSCCNVRAFEVVDAKLGGREKAPKNQMKRLLKYEQPEKHERAVNIKKRTKKPKVLKKAPKHKKAQLDKKRKKKNLNELLSVVDDPDPRKRAASLDKIVGVRDGSALGKGLIQGKTDPYFRKIQQRLMQEFVAPGAIPREKLRRLVAIIHISEIAADGTIKKYRLKKGSGVRLYDRAVEEAVQRFMPDHGGSSVLPRPSPDKIRQVKGRGIELRMVPVR